MRISRITTIRTAQSHVRARRRGSVAFAGTIAEIRGEPETAAVAGTTVPSRESVVCAARDPGSSLPRSEPYGRASRPRYPILLIRVNIGRYIAMTIPPMITPRMKIMTGSISFTSPWTATSTSSS